MNENNHERNVCNEVEYVISLLSFDRIHCEHLSASECVVNLLNLSGLPQCESFVHGVECLHEFSEPCQGLP